MLFVGLKDVGRVLPNDDRPILCLEFNGAFEADPDLLIHVTVERDHCCRIQIYEHEHLLIPGNEDLVINTGYGGESLRVFSCDNYQNIHILN